MDQCNTVGAGEEDWEFAVESAEEELPGTWDFLGGGGGGDNGARG